MGSARRRVAALFALALFGSACAEQKVEPAAEAAPVSPPQVESPARPDLILVTWDTVRWDYVGSPDGKTESHTPGWDALAREGVTFLEARTPAPITLPAHASILTGLTPSGHGARHNTIFHVDPSVPSLAEELRDAGYTTAAFVSSDVLAGASGLERGFSHFDDRLRAPGRDSDMSTRRADKTVTAALAFTADLDPDVPMFLWVHLFDPHRVWNAPLPFSESFDPYRAEIAFVDMQTSLLLEVLDARRDRSRAVVVVTSDHGEGLGEHGEVTHSFFAYDSTVRVPLLLWAGSKTGVPMKAGAKISGPASLVDLAPTFREIVGLHPRRSDGRSLVAHLQGGALPPRDLMLETTAPTYAHAAAPIFGVVTRAGEVWFDVPERERYDLESDPGQRRNLYEGRDAARADALFSGFDFRWPPETSPVELEESQRKRLAALGYFFDATSPALPMQKLPDAKSRVASHQFLQRDLSRRNPRSVLAELESLRGGLGPSPTLIRLELSLLEQQGRLVDALDLARESVAAFPEHPQLVELLDSIEDGYRQHRVQIGLLRARVANRPEDLESLHALAARLQLMQEFDEALRLYERLKVLDPTRVDSALNYAITLVVARRDAAAIRQFDFLRSLDDRRAEHDCAAGRVLGWVLDDAVRGRAAIEDCRRGAGQLSVMDRRILAGQRPES